MKKNVIYYSLFIPEDNNLNYYMMLYYSLLTLEKYYDDSFDIVVYYSSYDRDIKKYNFFNKNMDKYNLFDRFSSYVKFIESDYISKGVQLDQKNWKLPFAAFAKWYNIMNVSKMGYDYIFSIDCDVFYTQSPIYLFNKYKPLYDEVYSLTEGNSRVIETVLGKKGMCGGQHIFLSDTILKKTKFYETCIQKYFYLEQKAHKLLNNIDYNWFMGLSEQYSVQVAFDQYNIVIKGFDNSDICFGRDKYKEKIENGKIAIYDIEPKIYHYLGMNAFKFLPEEFQTASMIKQYKKYVKGETNGSRQIYN